MTRILCKKKVKENIIIIFLMIWNANRLINGTTLNFIFLPYLIPQKTWDCRVLNAAVSPQAQTSLGSSLIWAQTHSTTAKWNLHYITLTIIIHTHRLSYLTLGDDEIDFTITIKIPIFFLIHHNPHHIFEGLQILPITAKYKLRFTKCYHNNLLLLVTTYLWFFYC